MLFLSSCISWLSSIHCSLLISLLHLFLLPFFIYTINVLSFLADCDIFSLNFLTGIRTGCWGHFLLLYNSMTLNCPKIQIICLTSKCCFLFFVTSSPAGKHKCINRKKNVPLLEYCIDRNEKLILENMYFIVLFSVTNKNVNVKEFCWTLISKKCDFNTPGSVFSIKLIQRFLE